MDRIDLMLSVDLPPQNYGFDEGADDFILLLKRLRGVLGFDVDWHAIWEEHGTRYSVWNDLENYVDKFREHNKERSDGFSIWAHESSYRLYDLNYSWKNQPLLTADMLTGEIYRPHHQYGTDPKFYINLIEVVIVWKRPQHLAFGPALYARSPPVRPRPCGYSLDGMDSVQP